MGVRLRSAAGGSVQLDAPAGVTGDVLLEVPALNGAKVLTDKSPGTVLQVVSTTVTGGFSTTSTSYTDITGMTATITPKYASSKILVIASYAASVNSSGANNVQATFDIVRNGTEITSVVAPRIYNYAGSTGIYTNNSQSLTKLDSPSTVSALTYKLRGFITGPGSLYVSGDGGDATITLMEIAA
jgi:hypothetical protein